MSVLKSTDAVIKNAHGASTVNVTRLRVVIISLVICSPLLCAVDTDFYESFLMGPQDATWKLV